MNNKDKYGPFPHDADPLTKKCRLLQAWYRVEMLKIEKCGPWRQGERPVGSSLLDGKISGANFISPEAFAYAKQRLADKKNNPDLGLTIDEFRLFNNMLSSMPMCFNLFADFRVAAQVGSPTCTNVLGAIFKTSPIRRVEDVFVERIPQPRSHYIDDKTAWDAALLYEDHNGGKGLVSIETKYTDKLGGNKASTQDKKFQFAKDHGVFTEDGMQWYEKHGFDQVARNLLLTLAYAQKDSMANAKNYILAPLEDDEAPRAVVHMKDRLASRYKDCIELLPLETVVERGLACADEFFTDHLNRFRRRYLDFGQIAHLL